MKGVNKVMVLGNCGQDPEVRYMPNGNAIANVSIATSEQWKDKESGQKKEKTEWHRVVFYGKLAEIVGEYVRKGTTVFVSGKLNTRKWNAKDGSDRYTTEIIANEMQMIGGGKSNPQNAQNEPKESFEDFDDDIPF